MANSQASAYVNKGANHCGSTLCHTPDVAPVTRKGALCIVHDFIFKENSIQTFSSSDAVLFSAAFTCLTGLPPCIITFEFSLRSPVALMDHRSPVGQSEGARHQSSVLLERLSYVHTQRDENTPAREVSSGRQPLPNRTRRSSLHFIHLHVRTEATGDIPRRSFKRSSYSS